jgi:hypothetical protein
MAKKLIIPLFTSEKEEVAWWEKNRAAVEADMRSAMRNGKTRHRRTSLPRRRRKNSYPSRSGCQAKILPPPAS